MAPLGRSGVTTAPPAGVVVGARREQDVVENAIHVLGGTAARAYRLTETSA